MLDIVDTGVSSAKENMEIDARLLETLGGRPVLHLYRWAKPSITHGVLLDPLEHLNANEVEWNNLDVARRPTGGGILFHIWDFAFSFLLPSSHPQFSSIPVENYRFVNQIALEAVLEVFGLEGEGKLEEASGEGAPPFCMAKSTLYDATYEGKKVVGAAQRTKRQGYLHQGSISLATPSEGMLRSVLQRGEELAPLFYETSFAPLGRVFSPQALEEARDTLEEILTKKFQNRVE